MEYIGFIGTYIQLVTFVFGVYAFSKYRHSALKWLPIYLGLVASIELYCFYFFKENNVWLYNLLSFVQFNFFLYLFSQFLTKPKRQWIYFLMALFSVVYIGTFVFGLNDFFRESSSYGFVAGALSVILVLVLSFNEMLKINNSKGILLNLWFWFSFSLLIYYATSIPLFSISNWMGIVGDFQIVLIRILFFSLFVSQIILILGFIWSKRKYTY